MTQEKNKRPTQTEKKLAELKVNRPNLRDRIISQIITKRIRLNNKHDLDLFIEWLVETTPITKNNKYDQLEITQEDADKWTSNNNLKKTNHPLKLTDYVSNATTFHEIIPFIYDKAKIYWLWNTTKYKWEIVDETDMMNTINEHLIIAGETVTSAIKNNYLEAFKRVGRKKISKQPKKSWIQFKDKIFDIKKCETIQASPEFFMCNPIPWELGLNEETPVMDKLFEDWVGKENKKTLYEIIAYCCYPDYPIHLIFCLTGSGRNGKSSFQKLLSVFLGEDNVCSTELDSLMNNRFESFKLYKKLVAMMGETNIGVMSKTSMLKKLSGQDLISYEAKNKNPFDDYNYAKILINSNSLPTSDDTSEGFYRRWFIVDFPNEFPEGRDVVDMIPDVEYRNLARKVTCMLPRLIRKGVFTHQGSIEERRKKYIESSNPFSLFLEKCCDRSSEAFVSYNEFYNNYVKFLLMNKKRKVSRREFKAAMENEGLYSEKTSKSIKDNNVLEGTVSKIMYWVDGVEMKLGWKDFAHFARFPQNLTYFSYMKTNRKSREKRQNGQKITLQETIQGLKMLLQGGKKHNIAELYEFWKEELVEKALENLKRKGDIMEVKPGWVQRL